MINILKIQWCPSPLNCFNEDLHSFSMLHSSNARARPLRNPEMGGANISCQSATPTNQWTAVANWMTSMQVPLYGSPAGSLHQFHNSVCGAFWQSWLLYCTRLRRWQKTISSNNRSEPWIAFWEMGGIPHHYTLLTVTYLLLTILPNVNKSNTINSTFSWCLASKVRFSQKGKCFVDNLMSKSFPS